MPYILNNYDLNRILKHLANYYYPILKAFVQLLDLFELVGNQNQVVSPGQDDVYDNFHKICDEVYDDVYDSLGWCL